MDRTPSDPPIDRDDARSAGNDRSWLWMVALVRASFVAAVVLGWKQFEIWDSVREFIDFNPWYYFSIPLAELMENPWWIRTSIVLPSLIVSDLTSTNRNWIFGLYTTLAVLATIRLTNATTRDLLGRSDRRALITTGFLLSLALMMNGRIAFALLAAAMLNRVHFQWMQGRVGTVHLAAFQFLALVLMTVSTGAFYVGMGIVGVFTLLGMRDPRSGPAQGFLTLNSTLAFLPSAPLIVHQALLFQEKLERWHDGDYLAIVYHGPLKVFEQYVPAIQPELLFCVFLGLGLATSIAWLAYATTFPIQDTYLVTTVALGLLCGAFGWSTLLTSLPAFIVIGWTILLFGRPSFSHGFDRAEPNRHHRPASLSPAQRFDLSRRGASV